MVCLSKICGRQPLKNLKGYGLLKQNLCKTALKYLRTSFSKRISQIKQTLTYRNQNSCYYCSKLKNKTITKLRKIEKNLKFDKKEMIIITVRAFVNRTIIPFSPINACVTPRFLVQGFWITTIILDQGWICNVVDVWIF